ncbi:DNRLRE domain-containing protein [Dyadobacter sp. NIV53]|uniref:CBM96 family carbohydrate-binding protein n=1 Tax=Dyadobacter sp. NIV53 TaxID=2861765 RepID=UPI001C885528|nr:DNRLRE domain-containing protein [Dyadobacter sp. NIV53]
MENSTFFSVFLLFRLRHISNWLIFSFLTGTACFAQSGPATLIKLRVAANPFFQPVPPLCFGASAEHAIFYEDFESGLGAWTVSNATRPNGGNEDPWLTRNWVVTDIIPAGRTGKAAFAVNPASENCGTRRGPVVMYLTSPVIAIPAGASGPFTLAFEHFYDLQSNVDGGNLKYQINNGGWNLLPASAFTDNGYIMSIMSDEFNLNPLFGQPAFTNPEGEGSGWGQSRINLTALGLDAGQTIRFRWDMGTDEGCKGRQGWFVDDVRVYTCSVVPSVQFALDSSTVNEKEANIARSGWERCIHYAEKTITVKINAPPSQPVTVTLTTAGTATRGSKADYTITPASFTLEEGKLSEDIKVRINNDAYVEGNETITLGYTLSSPAGGNALRENYNQQHTVLIQDDDFTPGARSIKLFSEDFNGPEQPGRPIPQGWNWVPENDSDYNWIINNQLWAVGMGDNTPFLWAYWNFWGDQTHLDTLEKTVETPVFDSFGMSAINLAYDETFDPYAWNGSGYLDVWDGKEWHNVMTLTSQSGNGYPSYESYKREVSIPAAYASHSMKLRFRLKALYAGSWSIDNVLVTGTLTSEAATDVTSDWQQLGPNATAYFYDPASGKLIARIKNLTGHDYGCTTVSINRAGKHLKNWFNGYHISEKTFEVSPANDDPEGVYEMTLYYTEAELSGLAKVASMGRSRGGIGAGSLPSNSITEAVSGKPMNSDYSFTAVFNKGFYGGSGFGLSDTLIFRPVTLRINCGGQDFTDSQNRLFVKDQHYYYFNDRDPHTTVIKGDIAGTVDDGLYRSQRWGPGVIWDYAFSYRIPVHNGRMKVVLHFAEIYWGLSGRQGKGRRQFNVNIEDSPKLTNYDIYSSSGGALRARTETFTVDVSDGALDIDFFSGAADNPIIAAIEVVSMQLNENPVADATVRNIPNESFNYGAASTLEVKAGSLPSYQRKTYLKFPLAGIMPVGSAKLRLYGHNVQNTNKVNVAVFGVENDDWSETAITWANAPAGSGSNLGQFNADNTAKYYEIDVTSFVQSQLAGDRTVSFLLTNATSQNSLLSFNSRENTVNPPELVILPVAAPAARTGIQEDKVVADGLVSSMVYPNPASKQLTVEVSVLHHGKVSLCLTGLSGNSYPVNAVVEENILRADLSPLHLPPGIYILNIHSAAQDEGVKLLITE